MDSAAVIEKVEKINSTSCGIIKYLRENALHFSADEESEIEHFLRATERGLKNIKDIVENAEVDSADLNSANVIGVDSFSSGKFDTNENFSDPKSSVENDDAEVKQDQYVDEPDNASENSDKTVDLDEVTEVGPSGDNKAVMDDFGDDDFGEDDFDDSVLQQIEEAERSMVEQQEEEDLPEIPLEEEDKAHQPTDEKYLKVLKQYFGYSKFRPLQWKIIDSVLNERRDNCVIMATGYGKSLCYQYPSVYTGGTTMVISPLISLMEDQVLALSAANIKACFLGTAQTQSAMVMADIKRKKYRVVYITPEFAEAATGFLKEVHDLVGIDLIAVDEAHCVSQWGHDFRSSYRSLGNLRSTLMNVPMLAVTATATPQVMLDICKSLHLKRPVYTCTGFDRPNLYLSVLMKSGDIMKDLRSQMFTKDGKMEFEGPTIIYCPTKKATEDVVQHVKRLGIKAALYHAGLSLTQRKKAHKDFINDEIQVVVATVAFGMGIDKPDVRQIIHYGAPKDLESYYQEIGRAGRDGLQSVCHVFYTRSDFNTSRFFLKDIKNQKHLEHKRSMLAKMEQYLTISTCRRRSILSHFENKPVDDVGGTNRCCDNCTKKLERVGLGASEDPGEEQTDYGKEAMQIFKAIEITGERFGISVPIYFVRGSANQRLPKYYYDRVEYGRGKHKSEKWWKALAHQLTTEEYLKDVAIQGGFGYTVSLTEKARNWMSSNRTDSPVLKLTPNQELQGQEKVKMEVSVLGTIPKILPSVQSNIWMSTREAAGATSAKKHAPLDPREQELQKSLYTKLIGLRNKMSHELGIPTFVLVSNKSLLDMARVRPTSMETLLMVEELPEEKAQRYGQEFLTFIAQFCEENSIKTNIKPDDVEVEARLDANMEAALLSLGETARMTYRLFEIQKLHLEQASLLRGLKSSTLVNHLSEAIKVGLPVDLDRLGVNDQMMKLIVDVIRKPPINSDISRMTPIKEQLPSHVEFNHIKIVLAVLQRRFGMSGETLCSDPSSSASQIPCSSNASVFGYSKSQVTASQSTSPDTPTSGQKRKLPSWMASSSSQQQLKKKPSLTKKMKNNSLFRR